MWIKNLPLMRIEFRLSLSWIPLELICSNPNETRSSNRFHGKCRSTSDVWFVIQLVCVVFSWNLNYFPIGNESINFITNFYLKCISWMKWLSIIHLKQYLRENVVMNYYSSASQRSCWVNQFFFITMHNQNNTEKKYINWQSLLLFKLRINFQFNFLLTNKIHSLL